MKKITILFIMIVAAAAFVFAAEQSTPASAITEHRVVRPADLKWGEAPSGLPAGGKTAVLAIRRRPERSRSD
ncbi:MAG TPA: hypothetical protein VNX27_07860 [Chthoniobacterales bacterium]|nr:hypothetical protein [Chthoniobacterales bacterium]